MEKKLDNEPTSKEKMLRGSAWMTTASIFSRIIGAIYIIPWYAWFGTEKLQANAMYAKGYTVYAVFLMLSTAGIPEAVSKEVAYYNSLNEYGIGKRLYVKSFGVMLLMGIIFATLLWMLAPLFAVGDKEMIPVFRSLSFALIIIPIMSLTRGYFQGYQDMKPSAISQLFEQLLRVAYMLGATFFITQILQVKFEKAVVQSTFAAFVGAVGGFLLLGYYYLRNKKKFDVLYQNSSNKLQVSDLRLIKRLLLQSLPFIYISISTTLYNLFDQYTFPFIMKKTTNYTLKYIDGMYALFAANANKLIMIVISLAAAMSITTIPLLVEAITKKKFELAQKQFVDTLELFFFIMLPCSFGMAAVARPLYIVFYGYNDYGISVLRIAAYSAIAQGMFIVLAGLMQGISENKRAIYYTTIGLLVKFIVQYPLTIYLKAFGPLIATTIGLAVSCVLILRRLDVSYGLNLERLKNTFNGIMMFSLIMFSVVAGLMYLTGVFINNQSRIFAIFELLFGGVIGGYLYAYLALKTTVAEQVLGSRVNYLRKLLHVK